MRLRAAVAAAVPFALVAGSACSYAVRPPVVEAGRRFSESAVSDVKRGDTPTRVRSTLGEPFEIDGRAQRWRYFARVRGAEERRLLGFIPLPDSKTYSEHDVTVTFRDGLVVDVKLTVRRVR
jgi:outer membrane protein assembly factor BamE (lipoprotein component of BamABCDE complex)